jgi:hypothetical protein
MYVAEVLNVATLAGYKQRAHAEAVPAGAAVPTSRQAKRAWVLFTCMRISGMGRAVHVYVHRHMGASMQAHQLRATCGGGCECRRSRFLFLFFLIATCAAIAYESAVACGGGTGVSMGHPDRSHALLCLCTGTHLSRRFMVITSLRASIILSLLFQQQFYGDIYKQKYLGCYNL